MYKTPQMIKDIVIYNVLELIETEDPKYQIEAINKLKELSKFHSIPVNSLSQVGDRMQRLKEFVLNADGYIKTIPNLYRSLI